MIISDKDTRNTIQHGMYVLGIYFGEHIECFATYCLLKD